MALNSISQYLNRFLETEFIHWQYLSLSEIPSNYIRRLFLSRDTLFLSDFPLDVLSFNLRAESLNLLDPIHSRNNVPWYFPSVYSDLALSESNWKNEKKCGDSISLWYFIKVYLGIQIEFRCFISGFNSINLFDCCL